MESINGAESQTHSGVVDVETLLLPPRASTYCKLWEGPKLLKYQVCKARRRAVDERVRGMIKGRVCGNPNCGLYSVHPHPTAVMGFQNAQQAPKHLLHAGILIEKQ